MTNVSTQAAPGPAVAAVSYRDVAIGRTEAEFHRDGEIWRVRSREALQDYPQRMSDCLATGAARHPERVLVAQRGPDGNWITITYGEMLARARSIGQALVDRSLSAERPLVILSGNDLEHLQLALGALWAGVPFSAVSPPYSLVSGDFGKLRHVVDLLTPGLVYAADGRAFARAIEAVVPAGVEVVTRDGILPGRAATSFDALAHTRPGSVDAANAAVGPDTIAKFLFTSGSTRLPKAVTTTHRMLCSNQQMLRQAMPELARVPPVLVDWLPWNHTFGGSHTSASCCTTVARSTSMAAGPCRAASMTRCATCARSHLRSTSTCRRAGRNLAGHSSTMPRCARRSSRASISTSLPRRASRRRRGTASSVSPRRIAASASASCQALA